MRNFILTSDRFTGRLIFGFHSEFNMLAFYNNESEMSEHQYTYILKYLPHTPEELQRVADHLKAKLIEQPADTSFEAFWNAYGKKINRLRSEPLYKKLSAEDKLLAIVRIRPYRMYCSDHKRGIVDPERYLRERFFDTDWRGL